MIENTYKELEQDKTNKIEKLELMLEKEEQEMNIGLYKDKIFECVEFYIKL